MKNVENFLALLDAAFKIQKGISAVAADGKAGFDDLKEVPALIGAVRQLWSVDYADILPEFKDLDDQEKAQVVARFKAGLDLDNDSLELNIEQGFEMAIELVKAVLVLFPMLQPKK